MDIGTSEREVSWIFVNLTYPDIDGYRNLREGGKLDICKLNISRY
jgi:hypothetical protein